MGVLATETQTVSVANWQFVWLFVSAGKVDI